MPLISLCRELRLLLLQRSSDGSGGATHRRTQGLAFLLHQDHAVRRVALCPLEALHRLLQRSLLPLKLLPHLHHGALQFPNVNAIQPNFVAQAMQRLWLLSNTDLKGKSMVPFERTLLKASDAAKGFGFQRVHGELLPIVKAAEPALQRAHLLNNMTTQDPLRVKQGAAGLAERRLAFATTTDRRHFGAIATYRHGCAMVCHSEVQLKFVMLLSETETLRARARVNVEISQIFI